MAKQQQHLAGRFSVSLPRQLLADFDAALGQKGYHNRSLAIADIVRGWLVEQRRENPQQEIAGAITLVYDHHKRHLQDHLTDIQHDHHHMILATMHVHLDHHNCLEIIAVRGRAGEVQNVADALIGAKGVKHGRLTITSTGKDLPGEKGSPVHIPDGFLDAKTAAITGALAATGLGFALWHARKTLPPRKVPLLGLSAAFIFAAQMLNFPVIGGTSGHLVGGVLAAALLGPSAAVVVISAVLIVQCFMFADGGITALGANIFNMGILGAALGGLIYAWLARLAKGLFGRIVSAVIAAWASILIASIACAGELAASGTADWRTAFPAMAGIHAFIGIGEGVITAMVLSAVAAARPELVVQPTTASTVEASGYRPLLAFGILAALGLAIFVSPFASPWPDGLDKTAEDLQFADKASEHRAVPAPVPDYVMPGVSSDFLKVSLAGAVGTLTVLGAAWLVARVLVPKRNSA